MLIKCTEKLNDDSLINIEVRALPGETISFTADIARITKVDKYYQYALTIKEINNDNKKLLSKLITLLSLEKTKIVEAWNTLNKTNVKASMMFKRNKL